MRRLTNILLALLVLMPLSASTVHRYAEQSVLSSGRFVKIRVGETGICKITYEQLREMGLEAAEVRVFGYGGGMLEQDFKKYKIDDLPAVPFYMEKGTDGVFGKGDYILFYAQGPVSWTYTGLRFKHTQNTYSQYGYYFLSDNTGVQLTTTVKRADNSSANAYDITTYQNRQLHEEELINLIDKGGSHGGGREWYGESFTPNQTLNVAFTFPDVIVAEPMQCYVDAASVAAINTSFEVTVAGQSQTIDIPRIPDMLTEAVTGNLNGEVTPAQSATQKVSVTYLSENASTTGYLNYIELTATCGLNLRNGLLLVRNTDHYGEKKQSRYHISGATENTLVWNITRLDSIYAVETAFENGELTFLSDNRTLQEYAVLDPQRCPTISLIEQGKEIYEKVENQNLHNLRNIDMVVLTNKQFLSSAERLANAHNKYDGLKTVVVTDSQVYNEFSSGTPDATAYRWFMKMLRDNAIAEAGTEPSFLQLIGDGTFDNRKLLAVSGNNWLLTYQARNSVSEVKAYATDDYFTFLDDEEGNSDVNASMDISVGRLPVNTTDEADKMVDKIIRYISDRHTGSWKRQTVFLADDGDNNLHTESGNQAAEIVRNGNPDFIVNKIFLDAYKQETNASGESYPIAKNQLDNLMQKGVLLFDYCGHAGPNNITSELMLTASEVREMSNQNQGFWMLATCNFAQYDARVVSAAEEAVLNPNGGAIAIMASCRTVYASQNTVLNNFLMEYLFEHDDNLHYPNTIGQAVQKAKNKYMTLRKDENKLPYHLLGDPALRLHYPTDYQVMTEHTSDTLKALAVDTIQGYIKGDNQEVATDFNGVVYVSVYDKAMEITTLDNDHSSEADKTKFTYTDYPNLLFSGKTDVTDGKFSISLMIPKDIRYEYGAGRIVYYAQDTLTGYEGVGHYEQFMVGGSSNIALTDTTGPQLQVYLNNAAFEDGGKTDVQPHFYAHITDEYGINTVGNGIGHDLLLTIDNDIRQTYILNDYFSARKGSYSEGDVSYKLSELEEGEHELMFRAWNLINNSATATLRFRVVKNLQSQLFSVTAYPNPVSVTGTVRLRIEHDRPDATLETRITVFDLAGNKLWQHEQIGADDVHWNISDNNIHAGVYLYQVEIKTADTGFTRKTGKLIVNN